MSLITNAEHAADAREEELDRMLVELLGEPVHLEEHDEVPGEWGVWVGAGDAAELIGAGMTRIEALDDAFGTAFGWAAQGQVTP